MGDYPNWAELRAEIDRHEDDCSALRIVQLDQYMRNLSPAKAFAYIMATAGSFFAGIVLIFHASNAQDRADLQQITAEVKHNKETIQEIKADIKGSADRITQAMESQAREFEALREDLPRD